MARILFIDDDPITLKMLCKIAELQGHQSFTASSGLEALTRVAELVPDLILLDMMMPDMDGFTVLGKLRDQVDTADIPVVVLSAGFEMDAEERARDAGAQAYLTKPISMDALREVIHEHTGHR